MSTIAKAIAAFLTSLVALLAVLGFKDGLTWVTPDFINAVSAVIGALLTGYMTWLIPNKTP